MLSYWEQQSFLHQDVVVIGAGITGLSAAISLKKRAARLDITVLERGILPAGASTRNAGFACIGSFTEVLEDLRQMPEDKVLELIGMRQRGLRLLRDRLGESPIGYRMNGSYELIGEGELPQLDQMDRLNDLLRPVLGGAAYSMAGEKLPEFGFHPGKVRALIANHFEGELDTGKMMRQLSAMAGREGIRLLYGCRVISLEEKDSQVMLKVLDPAGNQIVLSASRVAVCTNAFTRDLLPEVDITPGRGQVLLTAPVAGLKFRGIFHFDRGYYYFREIDGRVLFGGGRNLDFLAEGTTVNALNDKIQQDLEEKLSTVILGGQKAPVAERWSGIMAFGSEKFPLIKPYSQRISLGVRMGGMGIAIGSEVGERLADMVMEG